MHDVLKIDAKARSEPKARFCRDAVAGVKTLDYLMALNGAQALVRMLENRGVTHVFGIPGAKIDSVYIALLDSKIKLVVCRHEQNAAFMAAAMGRMTGRIGVCLVTSGPGVTNLVTGLATATSEGDPVLAIGGEVPLADRLKHTHQAVNGVDVMRPVTKYSAEALTPRMLPEVFGAAVRAAESGRPGAAFIGLPKDVSLAEFEGDVSPAWGRSVAQGAPAAEEVRRAAAVLNAARRPMAIIGLQLPQPRSAEAVKRFLARTGMPYAATFQGAGLWAQPEGTIQCVGRLGLFRNQPADRVLDQADCVVTIGFDPIEFDPIAWNDGNPRPIVAIDVTPVAQDQAFLPSAELIGDIDAALDALTPRVQVALDPDYQRLATEAFAELAATALAGGEKCDIKAALEAVRPGVKLPPEVDQQIAAALSAAAAPEAGAVRGAPVHPLRVIHELCKVVTPQTTVALDIGSHYIWMCRYFTAVHARQTLISNGQQTLGVALPWAIAANLARPGTPVISVSGDGGFLFSAMELETAKRIGSRFIHLIWNSRSYDMVSFQEEAHYGRTAGVALGHFDVPALAASFGCKGYAIGDADELGPVLVEALASEVPVLIDIPIDYSENIKLMQNVRQDFIH